jgi:hypothetical protein
LLPVIVIIGVLYHWVSLNVAIMKGTESQHWPATYGKVKEAIIVTHSESRTNTRGSIKKSDHYYEVTPKYSYIVEGTSCTNNMATSGGGWFFESEVEAKQAADSIRFLSSVTVFYDPSDPSNSVLERGVPDRESAGMRVTIPAIGGAAGMAFNGFSKKRIQNGKRRVRLSIQIGTGVAIVAGILQWLVLALLI